MVDWRLPIAGAGLSKKPHRWIPRRIVAVEHPSPIRHMRQQNPRRFSHRAGEMRDRRIDGDDQIQITDERGTIVEIAQVIRPIRQRQRTGGDRRFF